LQGRMNATVRTINWGTMPVGAMIGGTLGSTVGVIGTILAGGGLQGAAVLWIVSKHVIRLKEMPKPDEAQVAKKAIKEKGLLQEREDEKKCEVIYREMAGMTIVRFADRSNGGSWLVSG
jgi:hypothetical protein